MQWLARLRLGALSADVNVVRRFAQYASKTTDDRRLAFTDVLARALPESRRAPLVLFRLVPLALHVATALAFGDRGRASEVRDRQTSLLEAIADCRQCGGRVLENGQQCGQCGNPLWTFRWLTTAD